MSKGRWAFRPAALTRAIKAAEKAGKTVAGVEIDSATGDIVLRFGESGGSKASEINLENEWDKDLINGDASVEVR
jgi:hypothetical protein